MKRPYILTGILSLVISALSLFCNIYIILLTATILALVFFITFIIKGKKVFKNSNNIIALTVISLIILSSVFKISSDYKPTAELVGTSAEFVGVVVKEPETHGDWTVYTMSGKHSLLKGNFKCAAVSKDNSFNIGDTLYLTLKTEEISEEYKSNNLSDGIYVSTYIKSVNKAEEQSSLFYTKLGALRLYIKEQILSVCDGDTGGVLLAFLTGNNSYISDNLYEKTKTCGVTHILVVSGLHVGILSGLVSECLSRIKVKRKISVAVLLVLFLLLIALCDFHTSAVRSVIMGIIVMSAPLINRRADSLNSLGFAVTVMALFNPFIAGSPSFLLSVFATFGVVFVSPMAMYLVKSRRFEGRLSKLLNVIINSVIVSVSATVCVFPVSLYYFGYTSLLSPLVTVLIGFAVEAALVLVAAGILLSAIPFIKSITFPIIYIAGIFTRYINSVIEYFGATDAFVLYADPVFVPFFVIFCTLLILSVWLLYNYKKIKERKDEDAAEREISQKLS